MYIVSKSTCPETKETMYKLNEDKSLKGQCAYTFHDTNGKGKWYDTMLDKIKQTGEPVSPLAKKPHGFICGNYYKGMYK